MHMYDIYCVGNSCGDIIGDYSMIFSVCTFRKVLFDAVIMLKFL
jgi:hypothetical protein